MFLNIQHTNHLQNNATCSFQMTVKKYAIHSQTNEFPVTVMTRARHGISEHRQHDCLLNTLFRLTYTGAHYVVPGVFRFREIAL